MSGKTQPICPKTKKHCVKPCIFTPEENDRRETSLLGVIPLRCGMPQEILR